MNKTITSTFIKKNSVLILFFVISLGSKAQQTGQTISSVDTIGRKSNELILTDGTTTKKIIINRSFDGQKEPENGKKNLQQPLQIISNTKND